jgi:hypothetical protein
MKTLTHPVTGKTVKMGRNRPARGAKKLQFHEYLGTALPQFPTICDYTAKASPSLSRIYLNDQLGDCVIAGGAHVRGITSGNNGGSSVVFTDDQIQQQYSAITGYVPGNPATDNGTDEVTAMNWWMQNGWPDGVKLAGWVAVRASMARMALYLFENLFFGVELPDAWVNNMPSGPGFTWDVAGAPDQNNGHCFIGGGYTPAGFTICTWGMLGTLTDAALEEYATSSGGGELYALVSHDMISKASAKAPNGLAWADLQADMQAFRS